MPDETLQNLINNEIVKQMKIQRTSISGEDSHNVVIRFPVTASQFKHFYNVFWYAGDVKGQKDYRSVIENENIISKEDHNDSIFVIVFSKMYGRNHRTIVTYELGRDNTLTMRQTDKEYGDPDKRIAANLTKTKPTPTDDIPIETFAAGDQDVNSTYIVAKLLRLEKEVDGLASKTNDTLSSMSGSEALFVKHCKAGEQKLVQISTAVKKDFDAETNSIQRNFKQKLISINDDFYGIIEVAKAKYQNKILSIQKNLTNSLVYAIQEENAKLQNIIKALLGENTELKRKLESLEDTALRALFENQIEALKGMVDKDKPASLQKPTIVHDSMNSWIKRLDELESYLEQLDYPGNNLFAEAMTDLKIFISILRGRINGSVFSDINREIEEIEQALIIDRAERNAGFTLDEQFKKVASAIRLFQMKYPKKREGLLSGTLAGPSDVQAAFELFFEDNLLPFIEGDLERMIQSQKGPQKATNGLESDEIEEVKKNFLKTSNVEEIEIKSGSTIFNSELHYKNHADINRNFTHRVILEKVSPGYRFIRSDKVIRKASVVVNELH